ncbi:hypothetical protein QJS10_CPA01g02300 [Acorus calamus]|uniref:Uncharacterized protein n=1 Tax=Acorus calamus TaxID=4465 RepID=A0AAV9FJR6_ACOCL|nr:hypothetical protein QJS10_CPA01g02300 [Acorus calamus]
MLRYIEPTIEGSNSVASLNPETYSKNIKQWEQALIGYIIDKPPSTSEPKQNTISETMFSNKYSTLQDNLMVEQILLEGSMGTSPVQSNHECQKIQLMDKEIQTTAKDNLESDQGISQQVVPEQIMADQ